MLYGSQLDGVCYDNCDINMLELNKHLCVSMCVFERTYAFVHGSIPHYKYGHTHGNMEALDFEEKWHLQARRIVKYEGIRYNFMLLFLSFLLCMFILCQCDF